MIRLIIIGAACVLLWTSCKQNVLSSATWTWEDGRWIHGDRKTMTMEAVDTTSLYQMDLKLNHAEDFGYSNLYVRVTTTYPSGKEVVSVTSLELAEPDGSWAGDYGENCCKLKLPLQRRFTFPETGTFTWTIEPYMRIDTITGIERLKVSCSKMKPPAN